jgi:hypothetical protein
MHTCMHPHTTVCTNTHAHTTQPPAEASPELLSTFYPTLSAVMLDVELRRAEADDLGPEEAAAAAAAEPGEAPACVPPATDCCPACLRTSQPRLLPAASPCLAASSRQHDALHAGPADHVLLGHAASFNSPRRCRPPAVAAAAHPLPLPASRCRCRSPAPANPPLQTTGTPTWSSWPTCCPGMSSCARSRRCEDAGRRRHHLGGWAPSCRRLLPTMCVDEGEAASRPFPRPKDK